MSYILTATHRIRHRARLYSLNVFDTRHKSSRLQPSGNLAAWLATPIMVYSEGVTLDQLTSDEQWMSPCAGIYRADGVGMVVGSAGTGVCASPIFLSSRLDGSMGMRVESWMCGVQVDPGERRSGEETLFLFDRPQNSIETWVKCTGRALGARRSARPISGWCSWYDKDIRITEEHVLAQLDMLSQNKDILPVTVVQVDDGYQKCDGDWRANQRFPSGLSKLASRIREAGFTPGIWISPLKVDPHLPWALEHPECLQIDTTTGKPRFEAPNMYHPNGKLTVDPTHPGSRQFIRAIIRNAVDAGYGYLKLDFNDIQQTELFDKKKTQFEAMRELYSLYRHEAGNDVYINACMTYPEMAVVGYVDACRIGPDAWVGGISSAVDPVMHAQHFNRKWFANDPDVTYLAAKLQNRVGIEGGINRLQTWHSLVGLTGGLVMTSEPLGDPDCRPHWPMWEVLLPPSPQDTHLISLGRDKDCNCFGFTHRGRLPAYSVALIINRRSETRQVEVDLNHLFEGSSLDSSGNLLAWSYWDDALLGNVEGHRWSTAPIAEWESQLVRFSDITGSVDEITLIGSTLHITCGAAEIHGINKTGDGVEVLLTDAGAREGTLTFYSTSPITVGKTKGCTIGRVECIADKVWCLSVRDRQVGSAQRFHISRTT